MLKVASQTGTSTWLNFRWASLLFFPILRCGLISQQEHPEHPVLDTMDVGEVESWKANLSRYLPPYKSAHLIGNESRQRRMLDLSVSPVRDTAFLLRTYADLNGWKLAQIERYVTKLRPLEVPVFVIRDISFLPEGKTNKSRSWRIGNAVPDTTDPQQLAVIGDVPLCDVTWTAVETEFTHVDFSEYSQLGGLDTTIVKKGGVHNPFELLWWRHCLPKWMKHIKYIWMAEDDAFFVGHLERFLMAFESYKEIDLIAGGFRIAGENWWNIETASSTFPERMLSYTRESGVVTNVRRLPTLADTQCSDGTADDVGTLFRQDVVERVSTRLIKKLEEVVTSGIVGPGEALLPSICAGEEWCKMYDFAPMYERAYGNTFASPQYCWRGIGMQKYQCTRGFQDK